MEVNVAEMRRRIADIVRRARTSQVSAGALISVGLTGAGAVIAYPIQVFLARTLGPGEYGHYAYAMGWLNLLQVVAALDMGGTALRFVGLYTATGELGLMRGFVLVSHRIVIALSVLLAALAAVAITILGGRLEHGNAITLYAGCVLLVPATLLQLELNLLQARRRTVAARVPNLIVRPLILGAALFIASRAERSTGAVAVLCNVVATSVALLLSLHALHRTWPAAARTAEPRTATREWIRVSLATLGGSLLYLVLSQQSDVIVVGTLVSATAAGAYSVASQIASLITIGVVAINHFGSPLMAEYQHAPREEGLRRLVQRLTLLNWMVALPIAAVALLAGPWLLRTFGKAYAGAYPTLVVLVVSQSINAVLGALGGTLLTMTGFQKEAAMLVVVVAALNLALTSVLTPALGPVGAALATCTAVAVRAAILVWIVRRRLRLWITPWATAG